MPQKTQKLTHITYSQQPNGAYYFECAGCHALYYSGTLRTPAVFEAVRAAFEQVHAGCQDLTTRPLYETESER